MAKMTVEKAIALAFREELGRDPRVLLLGERVATKHQDLVRDFGAARVRNTPLAEAIIAGTAVGAAASGLRPVIDLLFAPFMAYAVDALVNSAGKLRYLSGGQYSFPLVAMGLTGTGWCVGAQHNHNLEAMFVHAPGLKVVMPAEPADARGLLRSAIRDDNPVLFFTDLGRDRASDRRARGERPVRDRRRGRRPGGDPRLRRPACPRGAPDRTRCPDRVALDTGTGGRTPTRGGGSRSPRAGARHRPGCPSASRQ